MGTFGSGGVASTAVERTSRDLPVVLRRELASSPTEMNPLKGAFGESLARRLLDHAAGRSIEWIEPVRRSGQGIDLLGFQRDALGRLRGVCVYEVKFGTSRLGFTRDGQQLGEQWTARRLRDNAAALADQVANSRSNAAARTLREQAASLLEAADGRLPVERCVTRVEVKGSGFRITLEGRAGGDAGVLAEGPFAKLPRWAQQGVRRSFEEIFRDANCNREEARRLATEACRNPEFFRGMARDRRWTWRAGIDRHSAQAALGAAALAAGLRAVLDLWTTGRVGWRGVALSGLLGGAAGFAGTYAGAQTVSALTATQLGRALATAAGRVVGVVSVGRFAGGLVGAAVFAYGGALLGLTDWRTANRSMGAATVGLGAGAGATGATFGIAVAFGTAGTGTAITSLSGAAMVNAAMAWLGGGTIASGGLGMAGGAMLLTGVGAVVALVGSVTVGGVYRWLDERERRAMLAGRIELARLSLSA
jgi:hypothetical protein